jgi:hypothetical protein
MMANNNFLELNKMTLVEWVDKVLQQSLKKKPSNLGLGFVKFGNRIILP